MADLLLPMNLSRQEERVVALSMTGLGDKEIAREMGISFDTVRTYWQRIRQKVGGTTRAEIIATMVHRGLGAEIEAQQTENAHLLKEVARRREAEARLQAICDGSPIGIFVTTPNGDCVYTNTTYQRISGLTLEGARGKGWTRAIHPEDCERVFAEWYEAAERQTPFASHHRFLRPDGRIVWSRVRASQMRQEGELTGYVGTVEDITDLRELTDQIAATEERWRLCVEASEDGIWDWDVRSSRVYYSPGWKAMLGYADDELESHFLEWETRIHADDLAGAMAALRQHLDGKAERYEHPHRLRHRDGSYRWILARGRVHRDSEGRPLRVTGTHVDITAQKELESAVVWERDFSGKILGTIAAVIVVLDRDARIVRFNEAAERVSGYRSHEVLGRCFHEVFVPADELDGVIQVFQRLTAGDFPNQHVNLWRTKSGETRLIEWSNTCIADFEGRVQFVIGTGIDITEREASHALAVRNDERLRAAVESSFDAHLLLSPVRDEEGKAVDFVFEIVNGNAEHLFGLTAREIVGRTIGGLYGKHADPWITAYMGVLESGQPYRCVAEPQSPTIAAKWVEVQAIRADGAVAVTCRDVTHVKETRERLDRQVRELHAAQIQLEARQRELEEANARLQVLASTDGMTGLKNHRALVETLEQEVAGATRHGRPLSLLILDVDHFKAFNDAFGHLAGDLVLQELAETIRRIIRGSDVAARHGGEEFAVVMPETGPEVARDLAERIRAAVADRAWEHRMITLSVGCATYRAGMDVRQFIGAADDALYYAKRLGRNRVVHPDAPRSR